jgi:hypothetical protein
MASRPFSKRFLAMLDAFATRFRALLVRFATCASRWYGSRLVPVLPLPLFLACTLAALELSEPKWLEPLTSAATRLVLWVDRGMDEVPAPLEPLATLVTRAVYLLDSGLGQLGGWRPHLDVSDTASAYPRSTLTRALLGEWKRDEHMNVTLVTLTPEAYSYFLQRQTPIPRDRLACVIKALAEQIGKMEVPPEQRPLVAIDIDVAPTESAAIAPAATPGHGRPEECELLAESRCQPDQARCSPVQMQEELMARALGMLSRRADVVAIAFPRPAGEPRLHRNRFIRRTCCSAAMGAASCIHYASPMLVYAPQQAVYDYATEYLRPDDGQKLDFPGLGQVMAKLWHRPASGQSAARPATPYCGESLEGDRPSLDDLLEVSPHMVVQHQKIALGVARDAVGFFDVHAPAQPSSGSDFYEALKQSMEGLPMSRAYVLTVDSGTTDDKFSVPVVDVPVPGAWVHAAIAVTRTLPQPDLAERVLHRYLELAYWLIFGLLYAAAVDRLLARLKTVRSGNPVWHDIVVVVVPLATALAFLWFQTVFTAAPKIARGELAIPALLILGMMLESYLGAHAGHADEAQPRAGRPVELSGLARGLQIAGQWLWATAIVVSLLYLSEITKDAGVRFWQLLSAAALLGALVVRAGQSWRQVPLPWR